ncbi:MAG: hypothetical protein QOI38_1170 [Sphingomonadales bacterium]|jgi:hypothetical protein|nr:hypothetical protein [Sphingomonadales bacterium]
MVNGRLFKLAVVVLAGLVTIPASTPVVAQEGPIGTTGGPHVYFRGCWYYEHPNFGGERREIPEHMNRTWVGGGWNDRISALACHSACTATVFEHINNGGRRHQFMGNISYVGDVWNDRISSLWVTCSPPCN